MLAIYTRLSREDVNSTSISNQKREGLKFAKEKKIEQYELYNEGEGSSGGLDIEDRVELSRLITDITSSKITTVWMRNQNRLDRNTATFIVFTKQVKKYNTDVWFGDRKVDFNDPTSMFNSGIISIMNQYQRDLQIVQTKRSLRDSAQEGKVWGVIPYGYDIDENKKPIINKKESEIIKRIFKEYLKGKGAKTISTGLNREKIPTKYHRYIGKGRGKKITNKYTKKSTFRPYEEIVWSDRTVLLILKNKWYIGERKYADEFYEAPQIIDKDIFDRVQSELQKRKGSRTSKPKYNYLLKGLIRCSKCGRNYYGRVNSSKRDNYYMCSSNRTVATKCGNVGINIPYFENFIIQHLFLNEDLKRFLIHIDKNSDIISKLKYDISQLSDNIKISEGKIRRYIMLLGEELNDDENIISVYKNEKKNHQKLLLEKKMLENSLMEIEEKHAIRSYLITKEELGLNLDFASLYEAVREVIQEIKIESFISNPLDIENGDKIIFKIEIEYRHIKLEELRKTTWLSKRPNSTWSPFHQIKSDKNEDKSNEVVNSYLFNMGIINTYSSSIRLFDDIILDRSKLLIFNK